MTQTLTSWLISLLALYLACGLLFGVIFVLRGVGQVDPSAKEGSWGFRLIILPGVTALWPLLARRWWSGMRHPPTECNAHRCPGEHS